MAQKAFWGDLVENLELGILCFTSRAVVVFLFFGRLVEVGDFLGEVEYAVFDGVDGEMVVDVVVVAVDGAGSVDLDFLPLLAGSELVGLR